VLRSVLRHGLVSWLGLGLSLPLASCVRFASELDSLDSEGGSLDPALQPAAPGKDWACAPGTRAAATPEPVPLGFFLSAVDFVSAAPVEQLRVRSCYRADVDCASPVADELVADADGRVQISAPAGFNGYLEIQGAGMLPTLLFFAAPWSPQLLAQLERTPVQLLPLASLEALANTARLQIDPASGVVGVSARDCAGAVAPGVRLELDTSAVPYAFVDELPVVNQEVTSEQGLAGFVNVPAGVVVVRSFAQGQPEPVGVESLLVRGGWLSSMSLLAGY
jgi:hypothetical protein